MTAKKLPIAATAATSTLVSRPLAIILVISLMRVGPYTVMILDKIVARKAIRRANGDLQDRVYSVSKETFSYFPCSNSSFDSCE